MSLFVAISLTAIGAMFLGCALFRSPKNRALGLVALAVLLGSLLLNPLVSYFAFAGSAEAARHRMLSEARRADCVGRPASWLIAKYGPPSETSRVGKTEHWWYTPGPRYYVHEDYVGVAVENGHIAYAYMQINEGAAQLAVAPDAGSVVLP